MFCLFFVSIIEPLALGSRIWSSRRRAGSRVSVRVPNLSYRTFVWARRADNRHYFARHNFAWAVVRLVPSPDVLCPLALCLRSPSLPWTHFEPNCHMWACHLLHQPPPSPPPPPPPPSPGRRRTWQGCAVLLLSAAWLQEAKKVREKQSTARVRQLNTCTSKSDQTKIFPLQPRQKYNITQYEELSFS